MRTVTSRTAHRTAGRGTGAGGERRRRALALTALLPALALAGCSGPAAVEWDAERAKQALHAQLGDDAEVETTEGTEAFRATQEGRPDGVDMLGTVPADASEECLELRRAYEEGVIEGAVAGAAGTTPDFAETQERRMVAIFVYEDAETLERVDGDRERAEEACGPAEGAPEREEATAEVDGDQATAYRVTFPLFGGEQTLTTLDGAQANVHFMFQDVQPAEDAAGLQEQADQRAEDAQRLLEDLRG